MVERSHLRAAQSFRTPDGLAIAVHALATWFSSTSVPRRNSTFIGDARAKSKRVVAATSASQTSFVHSKQQNRVVSSKADTARRRARQCPSGAICLSRRDAGAIIVRVSLIGRLTSSSSHVSGIESVPSGVLASRTPRSTFAVG
jgi:hypothetical protein